MASGDIFTPVSTNPPPQVLGTRPDHPVARQGINQTTPIPTNKFYANFFLGNRTQSTWTHPYSLSWTQGNGSAQSWGMAVQHTDADQRAYGPDPNATTVQYFLNPLGIQSFVFSAAEFGSWMQLSLNDPTAFSVQAVMQAGNGSIVFPLVQGMGFVTGIYSNLTPMLQTGIFFRAVEKAGTVNGMTKYRITLEDSKIWLLYATGDVTFNLIGNGKIEGPANFSGIVQLAKTPKDSRTAESLYDSAAGTFALGRTLSGSIDGSTGNYNLSHQKQGNGPLLMFALPHHVQSITGAQVTDIQLQTTTKGIATAVIGDIWNLRENDLPVSMGFEPWSVSGGTHVTTDTNTFSIMAASAASETGQDINGQTNLDSMYFSGKGLSKFAALAWTIHDVLKDGNLASVALQKLKDAFAVFAENRQKYPLVYETAWKSLVSTAAYVTGDAGADFGNTWENDHHFHYAYFVHAAAIIGYLDSGWLAANREYVNSLVRDVSNPSTADPFFPVFRSFDWYSGHSWAKGLFESGDGKDEESTSEDALFSYALKMWGRVSGDANMEARGNLMLAVQRRSFNNYFLMSANNNVQPRQFIGNKAAGITFDNKIDHTTYFGANIEYIEGIHMIPIYPFTAYIRQPTFVKEEWDTYFSNGRADNINGGWRGLLYANLALIDPRASYNFFSRPNLDNGLIDPGASLTWYLAYTSSLLQASSSNSVRAAEFDPQINMSAPNDDAVAPVAQVADQSLLQQPVGVAQNSRDAPQGVADNPTPSQGAPQQQQPQPAPGKERRRSQIYKFIKGRFNL